MRHQRIVLGATVLAFLAGSTLAASANTSSFQQSLARNHAADSTYAAAKAAGAASSHATVPGRVYYLPADKGGGTVSGSESAMPATTTTTPTMPVTNDTTTPAAPSTNDNTMKPPSNPPPSQNGNGK